MSEGSEKTSEFIQKKVDESWKDSVRKEKERAPESPAPAIPETDFLSFMSTLAVQTMAALGEMPDPSGPRPEPDLTQAQYLIDVIQMLTEKTHGNATEQETAELNTLLYQLRVKFMQKKQKANP